MPTATYAGKNVAINDEGFFENPEEWTEEMAPEIARASGIDELTEQHWRVLKFMRPSTPRRERGRRSACSGRPPECP